MIRILQLTDCHLFTDPTTALRGIITWPRFLATLQDIRQRVPDFDWLVLTGDIAHDDQVTTYEAVRDALGDWGDRVRVLPGNHDDRPALRAVFPHCTGTRNEPINFDLTCDPWRLIGLDSQLSGQVAGELGASQLFDLRERLACRPDEPTLLFLHHPPIPVQSEWLDNIGLRDRAALADLLQAAPQLRLIVCGHVHQPIEASLAHAVVLTTPAVGPPFRPRTAEIEIDTRPPGYRILELHAGGRWMTQVLHVTEPFLP